MINNTAQLAKAVEAWDHLKDFPYFETFNTVVSQMYVIVFVAMDMYGITYIVDKYKQRMNEIEKKHPFYTELKA